MSILFSFVIIRWSCKNYHFQWFTLISWQTHEWIHPAHHTRNFLHKQKQRHVLMVVNISWITHTVFFNKLSLFTRKIKFVQVFVILNMRVHKRLFYGTYNLWFGHLYFQRINYKCLLQTFLPESIITITIATCLFI